MKDKIAKWYKQGLWSVEKLQNAVEKGIITPKDYAEFVSEVPNKAD